MENNELVTEMTEEIIDGVCEVKELPKSVYVAVGAVLAGVGALAWKKAIKPVAKRGAAWIRAKKGVETEYVTSDEVVNEDK